MKAEEFDKKCDEGKEDMLKYLDLDTTISAKEFCKSPQTYFRGGARLGSGRKLSGRKSFTVRIKPKLQQQAAKKAASLGMSFSDYIEKLLQTKMVS